MKTKKNNFVDIHYIQSGKSAKLMSYYTMLFLFK
mgnify:CR=1 FL=1